MAHSRRRDPNEYSFKENMKLAKGISDFGEKANTRPDWHEPDEQEVTAVVVGTKLDNAFGETIRPGAIVEGYQEIVICLRCDETGDKIAINLANLLATVEMLYREVEALKER
jgi:hypothetical protein